MVTQVEGTADVRDFFHQHVQSARKRLEVETTEDTERYLVDLLSGFSCVPDVPPIDEPLVGVLAWALKAKGHERAYRMRCLGDLALFRCGFFPDALSRAGITESYVVSVGGRAYDMVAGTRPSAADAAGTQRALFEELSSRFLEFVRVIEEVREQTVLCGERDLARLYAKFCESGSPALLRKLHRQGFFVGDVGGATTH